MNIKKILAVILVLTLCLALIAGCGKGNSSGESEPSGGKESGDSSAPSGGNDSGKKDDSNKDDGKKNDGSKTDPAPSGKDDKKDDGKDSKKDDPASSSDAPTEIVIPSATPGEPDAHYEVEPQSFSDTAGQVTKLDDGAITYKVMESKSGEDLDDYALFDPADYKTTDKTETLEYDDSTPFYTRQDDNWYLAAASQLKAGDTILIVINDKTGDLEGVIIFSK
ncbi:MAG: hypothetical protein J5569_01190 [Oscillospiraceae bacterium]|nr:hypothetical protein [Oscillospiraceae bacterium]